MNYGSFRLGYSLPLINIYRIDTHVYIYNVSFNGKFKKLIYKHLATCILNKDEYVSYSLFPTPIQRSRRYIFYQRFEDEKMRWFKK